MHAQQDKVVEFDREYYKGLCQEYSDILSLEKELTARKAEIRKEIISQSGGSRMEYDIKVNVTKSKGSVDYKAIAESVYPEEEREAVFEAYRKPEREVITITKY